MISRSLVIGDPHITPDALAEGWRLVDFVMASAAEHKVDAVIFLGDQYHTHSLIQLSVLNFWSQAFKKMKDAGLRIIALVGNHDKAGVAGETANAMMLHSEVELVDRPMVKDGILFVPYVHDPKEFVKICAADPTPLVICHQTFSGSFYENGFQIPDGVEPGDIPQAQILSGHIHTPQTHGKVYYPGAPRWRTASDANTERHLWVIDHLTNGAITDIHKLPTAGVCRPIFALEDTPVKPAVIPDGDASVVVDIYGPAAYVDQRKRELEVSHPGVRVRTFPETQRVMRAKESDGLPNAMKKFVEGFESKNGTPPAYLWRLARERISWLKGVE